LVLSSLPGNGPDRVSRVACRMNRTEVPGWRQLSQLEGGQIPDSMHAVRAL
jgi:hypothetical protein